MREHEAAGQLSLDELVEEALVGAPGAARSTDPDTAHDAALAALGVSGPMRRRVLLALHESHPDGLTDFEIGQRARMLRTTAGKRRKELEELGLVLATLERRPTDTGKRAIVWALTPDGALVAQEIAHDREARPA